jgi:hypothetical protein
VWQCKKNILKEFMDSPQCDITLCSVDWLIPFNCLPTNKLFNSSVFVYWEPSMELLHTYIFWRVVEVIGLTKTLDQLMLQISKSNGWMDWQKYPKNRKWIRIERSKALGCQTCLAFPGTRVQYFVYIPLPLRFFFLPKVLIQPAHTSNVFVFCNSVESSFMACAWS